MVHHFTYKSSILHAEEVDLGQIASEIGTPCYVYSSATFERHFNVLKSAFEGLNCLIAYSVKACGNLGVLATLARQGSGADVVSGGELRRALQAGIPANRIVFSGVAKSKEDLALALKAGIHQFNIESAPELYRLNEIAKELAVKAPIAFRVNPEIAAGGHANISTGKREDKFGIAWSSAEALYGEAQNLEGIEIVGVDVHIGSQIGELAPFKAAFKKVIGLVERLRAQGAQIQRIDLGGGLAIPYTAEETPARPSEYGALIAELMKDMGLDIILEPGRVIAGNAGLLLTRVEYVKTGEDRNFLILDAGMNDLMRPALYQGHHEILTLNEYPEDTPLQPFDVVGPICETTDRFARARLLPNLKEGDIIAFMSAGAYGAVMASEYNTRPLCPEVLVKGDEYSVVRRRPDFEHMVALEEIPEWF